MNKDRTKFLVCEKKPGPKSVTTQWIMPGGLFEEKTVEECLKNEIKEELDCEVDLSSIKYIGEYEDIAAGKPDKKVNIKLYEGRIIGTPKPSTEIAKLHWIGKEDINNPQVSPIIRNKIIPDLVRRGLLK